MQSKDADDLDEFFKTPEVEKKILTLTYLVKMKCVQQNRLPTLADMEVVYPRLNEKVVFSRWLRWVAKQYTKLKQENPFIGHVRHVIRKWIGSTLRRFKPD